MRGSVKSKLLASILLAIVGATVAFSGEVDARFNGKWIGVETFHFAGGYWELAGKAPQIETMIGVAKSGELFGILKGFAPGRYAISEKSQGNVIYIVSVRRNSKFMLSADGKTVKEEGRVVVASNAGIISCEVWATFHRIANK